MVEPSSSGAELGGLPAALPLPRLALILGGTGFIGRAIARRFLAVGVPVRIVARSGREDAIEAGTEVEFVQGDAADPLLMQEALRGVDRVVYAVGQSLPRESNLKPIEDVFSALPPLLSVLEALRGVPGTGFTFLSSGGTV
ncbi:MAG TPA: NAD-dependent epimerase/dehydratase family protein, partial [Acidimicrobiales bacterium]|nr:NAD-dependent epimerase/dehydratase family protein [Acidimicrobiales bacterium]